MLFQTPQLAPHPLLLRTELATRQAMDPKILGAPTRRLPL